MHISDLGRSVVTDGRAEDVLSERTIELVADRVASKIMERFEAVGLDLSDADARREMRLDFSLLRGMREARERRDAEREKGIILGMITFLFGAGGGALIAWLRGHQ